MRIFLILYLLTLPLQLLTTGAILEQGTKSLVIFTAIHAGLIAALFWGLLANALVATQIVEDGTASSLIVRRLVILILNSHDLTFIWFVSVRVQTSLSSFLHSPFSPQRCTYRSTLRSTSLVRLDHPTH